MQNVNQTVSVKSKSVKSKKKVSFTQKFDSYAPTVKWSFGNGIGTEYKTACGGVLSLFVSIGTLVYFIINVIAVVERKGTNVLTTQVEDYFD